MIVRWNFNRFLAGKHLLCGVLLMIVAGYTTAKPQCNGGGPPDGGGDGGDDSCEFYDPFNPDCFVTPIIIDLKGNGFSLTSAKEGIKMRTTDDAPLEKMAWTTPGVDDAWLVLDRNGNGVVDSLSELFGNFTPQPTDVPFRKFNGYRALAVYDTLANGGNGDGVIDARDEVFSKLRLWKDLNHDGISQPNELMTLPDGGIVSLDLGFLESRKVDRYGNQFRYKAKVVSSDGAGRWSYDVILRHRKKTATS